MTNPKLKNLAVSIKDRLRNQARLSKRPFQELLQYYAMERFLFRLSESPHRDRFLLKGGLLIRAWEISQSRATLDIDLLAYTSNDLDHISRTISEICRHTPSTPDGLDFSEDSIVCREMQTARKYAGARVRFLGYLGVSRVPMQIDVGFSDVVTLAPQEINLPSMLDLPPPSLRGYPPETVVAEKLQTIVEMGMGNTRIKDFYDLWFLSRRFSFDRQQLLPALLGTFQHRDTPLSLAQLRTTIRTFSSLSSTPSAWARCKERQLGQAACPESFEEMAEHLQQFLNTLED